VSDSHDPGDAGAAGRSNEFQRAMDRLSRVVQDFTGSTNDELSNRAARFMDDAADRLEREIERRNRRRERDDRPYERHDTHESRYDRSESRRSRHRRRRSRSRNSLSTRDPDYRTAKLYRDPRHGRVAGVCAGLARYFGVEAWVVRVLAVTGVIFMSSIVIPAYVIAWIVVPEMPRSDETPPEPGERTDHSPVAPELGARLAPRHSLRNVQSTLDQVELKLRLMESHVTSGQYELQRELRKIDS
jgi:phage shock protein C